MSSMGKQASEANWRALYPFASRWLDLPDGRMHYLDENESRVDTARRECSRMVGGAHPTLLFVHGNPTWSFHWRRLIGALRSTCRCIAPDHVGCGLSAKPNRYLTLQDHIENICRLITRLDLDRITLVAQDWGGAIGLGAMVRMPERLERIVLFNAGAFPPRYIPWRIRACRLPVIGRLGVQGANLFCRAALRMTLARHPKLEPAVAAGYLAPYDSWANRRAVYGFVRDIPRSADAATWQALASIERDLPRFADLPIALVWGMRDWCFRPDCLDRFREAWPRAEVHCLEDIGHWVVEDAPDESLRIVQQFLAARPAPVTS
ncbi:MAG TPA: alpha/beta fold hydrolase [Lacipirellulaceae bacterium]|nr:alpha/beta fold hydrolase [Lacipirellulaceae bacterium]